jgi:hypothetical protein
MPSCLKSLFLIQYKKAPSNILPLIEAPPAISVLLQIKLTLHTSGFLVHSPIWAIINPTT